MTGTSYEDFTLIHKHQTTKVPLHRFMPQLLYSELVYGRSKLLLEK